MTFGGSYGANLAMWLRLKQPNLVAGAIASSVSVQKSLLRETNRVLYSYINIQTCADLCACVMEKQINMKLPKNMDCKTYCESSTWDLTCTSDTILGEQCCQ